MLQTVKGALSVENYREELNSSCYTGKDLWWALWTLQGRTEIALLQKVKGVAVDVMNTAGKNWIIVTKRNGGSNWWTLWTQQGKTKMAVTDGESGGSWWRYEHSREELNSPCYRRWKWWQLMTLWTQQERNELALLQKVKVVAVGGRDENYREELNHCYKT